MAAAFNGTMDVIDFWYDKSILTDIENDNIREWIESIPSHKLKQWHGIPLHPIFHDGWHCAKQIVVVVFIFAIVFVDWFKKKTLLNYLLYFGLFGAAWYLGFELTCYLLIK